MDERNDCSTVSLTTFHHDAVEHCQGSNSKKSNTYVSASNMYDNNFTWRTKGSVHTGIQFTGSSYIQTISSRGKRIKIANFLFESNTIFVSIYWKMYDSIQIRFIQQHVNKIQIHSCRVLPIKKNVIFAKRREINHWTLDINYKYHFSVTEPWTWLLWKQISIAK